MKPFTHVLTNALLVVTKNNFVWFALTYWVYLETQSVISTSIIGGTYLVASALSSFWFGSLVDRYTKKAVMLGSSLVTLLCFAISLSLLVLIPEAAFTSIASPYIWMFSLCILGGVIAGNLYGITLPTLVTLMVPEEERDKANGAVGTIMGVSFSITSVASGLVLGFGGMMVVLLIALVLSVIALVHLQFIPLVGSRPTVQEEAPTHSLDIAGTIASIRSIPGLFALIFFTTFNNFLGGAFMALMDAYGLSLVSVQTWGLLWGVLSLGFILGGIIIAKRGLSAKPLTMLFRMNIVMWIICIFFTIQPSIILLAIGIFIWICLMPFVEATEQTIIQKVVPAQRQGRVFGFAHSIEQAASPLTAFFIGPITQLVFIPFMTTGYGAATLGPWYGVGPGRGIALVFSLAGLLGLLVTLVAMRSRSYVLLAKRYEA